MSVHSSTQDLRDIFCSEAFHLLLGNYNPAIDTTTIFLDEVAKIEGNEKERRFLYQTVYQHEWFERQSFVYVPIVQMLRLNVERYRFVLEELSKNPVVLKSALLSTDIAIKRIIQGSASLLDAVHLFRAMHFTKDAKVKHIIKKYKERFLEASGATEYYNSLERIREILNEDPFIVTYVAQTAFNYPYLCPNPYEFVFSLPLQYSPNWRFELLLDALEVLYERNYFESSHVKEISRTPTRLIEKLCFLTGMEYDFGNIPFRLFYENGPLRMYRRFFLPTNKDRSRTIWDKIPYMVLLKDKGILGGSAARGSMRDLAYWRTLVELTTLGREIVEAITNIKDVTLVCPFQRGELQHLRISIPKTKDKAFHPCGGNCSKNCITHKYGKRVRKIIKICRSVEVPQLENIWRELNRKKNQ